MRKNELLTFPEGHFCRPVSWHLILGGHAPCCSHRRLSHLGPSPERNPVFFFHLIIVFPTKFKHFKNLIWNISSRKNKYITWNKAPNFVKILLETSHQIFPWQKEVEANAPDPGRLFWGRGHWPLCSFIFVGDTVRGFVSLSISFCEI